MLALLQTFVYNHAPAVLIIGFAAIVVAANYLADDEEERPPF